MQNVPVGVVERPRCVRDAVESCPPGLPGCPFLDNSRGCRGHAVQSAPVDVVERPRYVRGAVESCPSGLPGWPSSAGGAGWLVEASVEPAAPAREEASGPYGRSCGL